MYSLPYMNDTTTTLVTNVLISSVESTFKTGTRFVSLTYTNQNGETSRYNLLMGVNLESLYKSDRRFLEKLVPTLSGVERVAGEELLSSITESLTVGIGNNSQYTLKGYYSPVTSNGEVKLHTDEKGVTSLYLRGYVIKKTTIKEGVYKTVNSSPKTLAKNKLEKSLKRGKLRTFKINVAALHTVKVNGMSIEIS